MACRVGTHVSTNLILEAKLSGARTETFLCEPSLHWSVKLWCFWYVSEQQRSNCTAGLTKEKAKHLRAPLPKLEESLNTWMIFLAQSVGVQLLDLACRYYYWWILLWCSKEENLGQALVSADVPKGLSAIHTGH